MGFIGKIAFVILTILGIMIASFTVSIEQKKTAETNAQKQCTDAAYNESYSGTLSTLGDVNSSITDCMNSRGYPNYQP